MRTQSEHLQPPPSRTTAPRAAVKVGFVVVTLSLLIPILAAAQQVTGCLLRCSKGRGSFLDAVEAAVFRLQRAVAVE